MAIPPRYSPAPGWLLAPVAISHRSYNFFTSTVGFTTDIDPVETVHAATAALDPTSDKWNGRQEPPRPRGSRTTLTGEANPS